MTEEIQTQQSNLAAGDSPAAAEPTTGGARDGAERKTAEQQSNRKPLVSWAALLDEAVKKPGLIHEAYSRFHQFSMGNQMLALFQCQLRGIQPGPLASFTKWKQLGRHVKQGEKALILCMPVTCTRKERVEKEDGSTEEQAFAYTRFTYKPHWFVLAQTEGQQYKPPAIPDWNETRALATLNIERIPFEQLDGNAQGYALRSRKLAINPLAALPHKTLFHELAHLTLGHTEQGDLSDSETLTRDVREVEAEAVALLCCEALGLDGTEYSRGYIQEWGKGQAISERSAQRIFHAADQILKAGYVKAEVGQ